jgi:hypothetical protein
LREKEEYADGLKGASLHFLLGGVFAFLFIIFSAIFGIYYSVCEFCFLFHLIPFGIGFSAGSVLYIFGYYIILFLLLWLMGFGILKFFRQIKTG